MIQANELRIGNYVYREFYSKEGYGDNPNNLPFRDMILPYFSSLNRLHAIPITEEWLVNFGFERMYLSAFRSKYTHKETHCIGYDFSYVTDKSMEGFTWYGRYVKDIKYIHQLQNLYFLLIGEELTFSVT